MGKTIGTILFYKHASDRMLTLKLLNSIVGEVKDFDTIIALKLKEQVNNTPKLSFLEVTTCPVDGSWENTRKTRTSGCNSPDVQALNKRG